eukprot:g3340.t1
MKKIVLFSFLLFNCSLATNPKQYNVPSPTGDFTAVQRLRNNAIRPLRPDPFPQVQEKREPVSIQTVLKAQVKKVDGTPFTDEDLAVGIQRNRKLHGHFGSSPSYRKGPWWQNRKDAQGSCSCVGLNMLDCKVKSGCTWTPAKAAAAPAPAAESF